MGGGGKGGGRVRKSAACEGAKLDDSPESALERARDCTALCHAGVPVTWSVEPSSLLPDIPLRCENVPDAARKYAASAVLDDVCRLHSRRRRQRRGRVGGRGGGRVRDVKFLAQSSGPFGSVGCLFFFQR